MATATKKPTVREMLEETGEITLFVGKMADFFDEHLKSKIVGYAYANGEPISSEQERDYYLGKAKLYEAAAEQARDAETKERFLGKSRNAMTLYASLCS